MQVVFPEQFSEQSIINLFKTRKYVSGVSVLRKMDAAREGNDFF